MDKNRATNHLKVEGVQYPNSFWSDDSNIIIRHIKENVNRKISNFTESQQFKSFFGDWQNNPQKASKIVNEDGTPKHIYHQTSEYFTEFDTDHPVAGKYDSETPNGIFAKDNDADIGVVDGNIQMDLYGDMKNH